ncbi:MAG: tRNA(Ile)(2)-agmatinylcytidine synthase [Caldisphaeraceae archaeon]|nr:tRNA(Ile)(2)-agmatinylcytidine synthase [Caldisphaeraceae archaeon]
MSKETITISFDDIDSQYGGCTTHFTGIFLHNIKDKIDLIDHPLLVRLNPGIPWKTRGNASTALRVKYKGDIEDLLELAISLVEEYTNPRPPSPNKKPGIVITKGKSWENERFKALYKQTISDVVLLENVIKILKKEGAIFYGGKGIIGAAAAQGALSINEPYTFELIYYRVPEYWSRKRCVDDTKVLEVEKDLPPCTINNYDYIKRKSSVKPNGPDPILAGFRGTCGELLWKFKKSLCEPPHFALLFRTNQHTNIGLGAKLYPSPYRNVEIDGIVDGVNVLPKGHVIVKLKAEYGSLDIAFYKDTGPLNSAAKLLRKGDKIKVMGMVRPYFHNKNPTISAISMEVMKINDIYINISPRCPICGSRMKSSGKKGGYKCVVCGFKTKEADKIRIPLKRELMPSLYQSETGELLHLEKEKNTKLPIFFGTKKIGISDVMKIYTK